MWREEVVEVVLVEGLELPPQPACCIPGINAPLPFTGFVALSLAYEAAIRDVKQRGARVRARGRARPPRHP